MSPNLRPHPACLSLIQICNIQGLNGSGDLNYSMEMSRFAGAGQGAYVAPGLFVIRTSERYRLYRSSVERSDEELESSARRRSRLITHDDCRPLLDAIVRSRFNSACEKWALTGSLGSPHSADRSLFVVASETHPPIDDFPTVLPPGEGVSADLVRTGP